MKTEYLVKFYHKNGFIDTYTYTDYGTALYDADVEYSINKDKYDSYKVVEVITNYKLVKSVKD